MNRSDHGEHVMTTTRVMLDPAIQWAESCDRDSITTGGLMSYVDGFVVPVPIKNLAAYRRMARKCGKVWREHGAIDYNECVADDVKPGKRTSFPQSVKLKAGETVVFSWIVYKSRAHRDRVNAKAMVDPRLADMMDAKKMPFDGKRMFWGGFKVFVSA
jgi:uncharacterized protein YbaA (DUF1428 family)